MKKAHYIFFVLLLLASVSSYAQDTTNTKPADFAIVMLTAIEGPNYTCTVQYSDGKKISLEKALDLPEKNGSTIHRNEMDGPKMKVFEYFYNKGYELMSITDVKSQPIRFYFKRKGL
jgi:hypothetical protein